MPDVHWMDALDVAHFFGGLVQLHCLTHSENCYRARTASMRLSRVNRATVQYIPRVPRFPSACCTRVISERSRHEAKVFSRVFFVGGHLGAGRRTRLKSMGCHGRCKYDCYQLKSYLNISVELLFYRTLVLIGNLACARHAWAALQALRKPCRLRSGGVQMSILLGMRGVSYFITLFVFIGV